MASSRRRASSRWPRFCQNRHIANAEPDRRVARRPRRSPDRARPGCCRARARGGRASAAGRRRTSSGAALARRARGNQSRGGARIASRSPLAVEPLGGELADRLEHPEARLAVGDLLDPDEALVDERHQAVEDVQPPSSRRRPADRLGARRGRSRRRRPTAGRTAAARRRRAGRSSRRSRRAASAGAPAGRASRRRGGRAGARAGRGSRPATRSLTRAAASSIASGRPSSRARSPATAGAFSLVSAKSGRTATARSMNSRTASYCAERDGVERAGPAGSVRRSSPLSGRTSGGRRQARAPGTPARRETRSGARLVTRTLTAPGAARSRSATTGAAARTCSKLSRTSSDLPVAQLVGEDVSAIGPTAALDERRASRAIATRRGSGRGSARAARRRRRPGSRRRRSPRAGATAASCRCRPGPVSVSSRVVAEQRRASASSRSRPTKRRQLGRQVVGRRVERPQRREVAGRPSTTSWQQPLGRGGP